MSLEANEFSSIFGGHDTVIAMNYGEGLNDYAYDYSGAVDVVDFRIRDTSYMCTPTSDTVTVVAPRIITIGQEKAEQLVSCVANISAAQGKSASPCAKSAGSIFRGMMEP